MYKKAQPLKNLNDSTMKIPTKHQKEENSNSKGLSLTTIYQLTVNENNTNKKQ